MDPFNPLPYDRPDHQQRRWHQGQEPSNGNKALWVLGILAGVIGVAAVISTI